MECPVVKRQVLSADEHGESPGDEEREAREVAPGGGRDSRGRDGIRERAPAAGPAPRAASTPMLAPGHPRSGGARPARRGRPMPGIGVRTAAVFLAETLGKTSRHRRPAGLLRRARSRHTPLRLIDPRRARLPRRQQEAQARHVPVCLRLTALRPRQPGLLPAQTRPRQTALGQAVLALAHRRILTLHAMIRNHTLYTPQPSTQLPAAA